MPDATPQPESDDAAESTHPEAKRVRSGARLNVAAAVLGWVLPGLGHFVLGQTARGLILAVTIGSLWMGGLLIGGITVIDRQNHPAWFVGQMGVAPSWVVNRVHDNLRSRWQREAGTSPDAEPGYIVAYGKPEEQGILYTALAGLLNLLAIIDVLFREPYPARQLLDEEVDVIPPVDEELSEVDLSKPRVTGASLGRSAAGGTA